MMYALVYDGFKFEETKIKVLDTDSGTVKKLTIYDIRRNYKLENELYATYSKGVGSKIEYEYDMNYFHYLSGKIINIDFGKFDLVYHFDHKYFYFWFRGYLYKVLFDYQFKGRFCSNRFIGFDYNMRSKHLILKFTFPPNMYDSNVRLN